METILILSRPKTRHRIHFDGFYEGKEIKNIRCNNHGLKKGSDYLLWSKKKEVKGTTLVIEIIKSKEII